MICFQLGSNAVTGNIIVNTSNGSSNGIPFTVRSGNIYFVDPTQSTNGTGTYASPFNRLHGAYLVHTAGDTIYVRASTITNEYDGYPGWHSIMAETVSGTLGNPIAWVAYPNETVTLQATASASTWPDSSDTIQYVFRAMAGYITVSKFTLISTSTSSNGSDPVVAGGDGWITVGNKVMTRNQGFNGSISVSGVNTRVIGNEISGSYCDSYNNNAHEIYVDAPSNPFEVAWNYIHDVYNEGWMISNYHNGPRIGTIHDNLIIGNSSSGPIKGILVDGAGDGMAGNPDTASTMYTNNVKAYNNILVNAGILNYGGAMQAVCGTNYIYNNTIYGDGSETQGVLQFGDYSCGPGGGNAVEYVANNIIYNLTPGQKYISNGDAGVDPNWADFSILRNNNYYGEGNGPTQDASPLNVNPQFISPSLTLGGNFQLQSTSPDINAGYNTNAVVTTDYNGLVRSSIPSLGAYEYTSGSSSPVVAITSPVSGSSVTSGSNISITATASEYNGTITNVSLYSGATLLGSSSSSPYTYVMNNPAVGSYNLTAVATDAKGVSTTSTLVSVTVSSQTQSSSPVVTITSPASGNSYTAGSNVTVTTTASETNGTIATISLYNGSGLLLGTSTSSPYNFVDSNMAAGGYSFYAVATDVNGVSTTSSTVAITITSATSPVVSIASPSNGSTYVQGSTFTITSNASETNGTISQVQYYSGSYLLASSSSSPYTASWTNATTGTFTLNAKAIDANGVSTMSSPITVTVVTISNVAPSITAQPASLTVTAPATATFSVAATGTPAPTFQWMQSVNGGAFSNISGATAASYTTAATTTANNGNQFKCVVTNASGSVTSNAATLTVNPAPVAPSITAQPASLTVTAPATATFSVAATGTPAPTYQWMQSVNGGAFSNINGATAASYTTAATTTANSGNQFKCVVTNASGSVTSNAATLTVNPAPVAPSITAQPASLTVTAPATATFSVAATGTPAPTFQWMQSVNGGAFSNISGATAASYTTAATTTANNGNQFKCVVTNASGSVTSNAATLTVNPAPVAPSITAQPASLTVTAPATATFSVAATGTPAPTYQWMQSVNGGAFSNISGATSASYTTAATTTANNGNQFKCVVTNASGSVTSNTATLTVNPAPVAPSITAQPASLTVTAPATATFSVAATGTPAPTFQWMQSVNGGAFSNISGATAASYTTAATTTANNGNQFKCVVTNASGSVTSNAATLTVNPAPVAPSITAQPASLTVTAPATATFSVAATGTPAPTYQWMQSVNGGAFSNISGATSASYTTAATTTANNGNQFKCVVTNASGSVTSNAATLTVNPAPVAPSITAQPASLTVTAPATATFSVAATGTPAPTFQWMQSVNGGAFSNISGATSASYTTAATTTANSGTQYECVVSNASGSVTSNIAALTVISLSVPPVVSITSPNNGSSIIAGSSINITANASETNGNIVQVQFFNGATLLGTSSASPYSYPMSNVPAGNYSLTAVATDANGVSTTSSAVALSVTAFNPTYPTVILTNPANGNSFMAGSSITISALAYVGNGSTISSVVFYNGSSYIGMATSSPYTFTWNNVPAGNYTLIAKVYYNIWKSLTSTAVNITVTAANLAPSIIAQPVSMTVTAPASATFSVAATGAPAPAFQWMQSVNGGAFTNISGATSSSYTTAATNVANSGTQFECVVTNASGAVTSNAATLSVNPAPVLPSITAQPASMTVTAPASVTFSVAATGSPAPSFQWMQSVNGGAFSIINGATAASYTTAATTTANSGTQFECVVTNAAGSVSSNAATLTVNAAPAAPSITLQPVDISVTAPANATFSVAATGSPAPAFQWMQSVNGGAFTNISGATSSSYTTDVLTTADSGTQYECVVSNDLGSVTSNTATVTVTDPPVIVNPVPVITSLPVVSITSPSNGSAITAGSSVNITATASTNNGKISKVQFYNGSTFMGTSVMSPYTLAWNNVSAGSYNLTAVAFDSNNNVATSSNVIVTVSSKNRWF